MRTNHDPTLDRAMEDAADADAHDATTAAAASILREAEDAQGFETFVDPDSTLPAEFIKEGPPGEETLTAGDVVPDVSSEDEEREGTT